MSNRRTLGTWSLAFVVVTIATGACIRWIDYPLASKFLHVSGTGGLISTLFGGRVLVTGELSVITLLALLRIKIGRLPDMAKTLLIACSASVMAYTLNDLVLKVVFGRQGPVEFYQSPLPGIFHFLMGDDHSSFPSGHMMLAGAFLGVFCRVYPRLRVACLALLTFGMIILVRGDWHYVSDVMAGTFLGFAAGVLAGELWVRHAHLATNSLDE